MIVISEQGRKSMFRYGGCGENNFREQKVLKYISLEFYMVQLRYIVLEVAAMQVG